MRPAESTSDLDLRGVEVRLLPGSHIVPDLHYGLQPFRWPLGEIIEAFIVLVTLQ